MYKYKNIVMMNKSNSPDAKKAGLFDYPEKIYYIGNYNLFVPICSIMNKNPPRNKKEEDKLPCHKNCKIHDFSFKEMGADLFCIGNDRFETLDFVKEFMGKINKTKKSREEWMEKIGHRKKHSLRHTFVTRYTKNGVELKH